MVDRAAGSGERSRGKGRCARGGNGVQEDSSVAPTHGDKVAIPRGATVISMTGGWRRLGCERSHRLVTACAVAGAGPGAEPGNQVAWLSHSGLWPVG
jgi:hypothetical protein